MRIALFWIPTVLYMPLMIPHLKMVFACSSYSISSYAIHPFFKELTCWHGDHVGYAVASIIVAVVFFYISHATAAFYYEIIPPYNDQDGDNAITSRVHNRVERYLLILKTALLVLFIAGSGQSWRAPLSLLLFVAGIYVSVLQVGG
jgi:hypothetical protein